MSRKYKNYSITLEMADGKKHQIPFALPLAKDGERGEKGDKGANGKTPVKGVDYFTEAEKADMVAAVISALPVYGGEVENA